MLFGAAILLVLVACTILFVQWFTEGHDIRVADYEVNTKLLDLSNALTTMQTQLTDLQASNAALQSSNASIVSYSATISENTAQSTSQAVQGRMSTENLTSTLLANGATYTGTFEDVSSFSSVTVAAKTDQSGLMYVDFSPDGTNVDSTLTFTLEASTNEVHRITVTRKYYRLRIYNNSGSAQTYLRASTVLGSQQTLTSVAGSTIQSDADTVLSRSIITGAQDNGKYTNVHLDPYGHLEVAIHGPLNPFGSIHVENLMAVFQIDGVYSALTNTKYNYGSSLGGSASISNSALVCSTTTSEYGNAYILSRKRLRYRPGQGIVGRFTALFTSPGVSGSYQVAGLGHAEDGYYFAFKDTAFGILQNNRGKREVRRLEITTASSTAESVTVKLNGTDYSIAVTNSANINRTAWEISVGTYAGWSVEQRSQYVYFVNDAVGAKSGAYSLTASTAIGTFSQIQEGVAVTETFVAQTAWNVDVMDGTSSASNPSSNLLDVTKFNIYQISMQYLGAGPVVFSIELAPSDGNNATWYPVHVMRNPNTLTATIIGNPSLPFTMSAYKVTSSATNLTVQVGSAMGAIEGNLVRNGPLISYSGYVAALGTSLTALFIVRNSLYFSGRVNQAVIMLNSIAVAARGGNSVLTHIQLIRNATIVGNPAFAEYDSGNSCALFANTASMTCSYTNNSQLVYSITIGETGEETFDFLNALQEIDIQPGEWIVVAASTNTSTAAVRVSLNTREDW